jgi:hypothetical protein
MPKTWLLVGVVVGALSWSSTARAQPGQTPAQSGEVTVTPEEYQMLVRGEYQAGEIIVGGLVGTFWGLGLGHAIQGRWSDQGWKFTLGELGSFAVMMYGLMRELNSDDYYYGDNRRNDDTGVTYLVAGAIGFAVFRIWELVDVWHGPIEHNNKLRELRWRTGYGQPRWSVFAAPAHGDGGVAGVVLRF